MRHGALRDGRVLEPYEVVDTDGIRKVAIADCDGAYWVEYELHSRRVNAVVRPLELPAPHPRAFSEVSVTSGGVGRHLRWEVIAPRHNLDVTTDLIVERVDNLADLEATVAETLHPFAFVRRDSWCDATRTLTIAVPDNRYLGIVAARLHAKFVTIRPSNPHFVERQGSIALERKDRARHMWWQSEAANAGPTRDINKWDYSYLPHDWAELPFTWESMAASASVRAADATLLPSPLREHVRRHRGEDVPAPSMKPLGPEQNRQILAAYYWRKVAVDKRYMHVSRLVSFRYLLYGYESRIVGAFRRTARHVGYGVGAPRRFKRLDQYAIERLDDEVLNRICTATGDFCGIGRAGTRSLHRKEGRRQPKVRSRREGWDATLRTTTENCFDVYESQSTLRVKACGR